MSATVLDMSMSLDGFIAGPNETRENGLGDGGSRLHEWVFAGAAAGHGAASPGGVNGQVFGELMSTGAVVAGRGTVEPAGYWAGDHHDGVPIFILSRSEPPEEARQWPLITFVDDVTKAMAGAKEAAGDRDVLVHGAGVARLALAAGVLDQLELHVIPVLFGQGRRLFEGLPAVQIELEPTRVLQGEGGVTWSRGSHTFSKPDQHVDLTNANCGTALPSGSVETDCAICREGAPQDVIGELPTVWIAAPRRAALPGYACVVAKRHVEEPFQLVGAEFTAFWSESMSVAAALCDLTRPLKMNYEIHGNTIPHLHLHLYPRFAGDPFHGRPIDGTTTAFQRTPQDIERLQAAIASLVQAP